MKTYVEKQRARDATTPAGREAREAARRWAKALRRAARAAVREGDPELAAAAQARIDADRAERASRRPLPCPACRGAARFYPVNIKDASPKSCEACKGTGLAPKVRP